MKLIGVILHSTCLCGLSNYSRQTMVRVKKVPSFIKVFGPESSDELHRRCPRYKRKLIDIPFEIFVSATGCIPWSMSMDLKIPSGYCQSIQEAWPKIIQLRNRYDNLWPVYPEKVGDYWYFKNGWRKFVVENVIETGDFIIFKRYKRALLDIKIFGRSSCEKKISGAPYCSNTEEQDKIAKVVVTDVESEDDKRDDDEEEQVKDAGASTSKKPRLKRRRVTQVFDPKIFEIAGLRKPKNPYFVTRAPISRKNELYMPKCILRHHTLVLPKSIFLVDPCKRKFKARLKVWTDGRTFYVGGWQQMCHANLLGLDDYIICEFKTTRRGKVNIKINFIRADVLK